MSAASVPSWDRLELIPAKEFFTRTSACRSVLAKISLGVLADHSLYYAGSVKPSLCRTQGHISRLDLGLSRTTASARTIIVLPRYREKLNSGSISSWQAIRPATCWGQLHAVSMSEVRLIPLSRLYVPSVTQSPVLTAIHQSSSFLYLPRTDKSRRARAAVELLCLDVRECTLYLFGVVIRGRCSTRELGIFSGLNGNKAAHGCPGPRAYGQRACI